MENQTTIPLIREVPVMTQEMVDEDTRREAEPCQDTGC
jgi:hypothetical protein